VKSVTSPPQADTAGSRTLSGEPVAELYTEADLEANSRASARPPAAGPSGEGPEGQVGRPGAEGWVGRQGSEDRIGRPGEYPFTRGVYESMYRGRLWTMRQFAGFGTSEETNERFHYLLEHGQTGLSTAFDMPSLMGHDSDSPRSLGEIGREGVAVDTVEDMRTLFGGIDLGEVSVSMTINAPAAIMLAFYVAAAESAAEGLPTHPPDSASAAGAASDGAGGSAAGAVDGGSSNGRLLESLSGTIQADILKEYIAQKEWCFPIDPAMRLCGDMIEWCTRHMPRWHPISISGYHIREAGATAQQELAFTLADGLTYVRQAVERGLDVDEFAPRLSFFFNAQIDLFEEIAKYRAARRIWARELRETFGAKSPRSWLMRFHAQTAGVSLTAQQPLNNIVRTAVEALAAVLGGAQSLHTNSYDEALALPTEEAVRVALRTQQVIAHETGVASTADPLGGSYFVEAMTDRMEQRCYEYFEKIEQLGGMVEAVKRNYPQREIADAAFELQREIDTGERIVVGVNSHVLENEQPIPTLRVDPALERKQLDRLQAARARRDGAAVERTLAALRAAAAHPDRNLMGPLLQCARACASEGEIVESLQQVFGDYTETPVF
jgi:methylmalonyl-CoA mutase N-terminal domain/subunit